MRLGKIKQSAQNFLNQYESQNPAAYAAALQAVGGLLILDGFIGIEDPFGGKKRSGIFGSLIGITLGLVLAFVPTIFDSLSGTKYMTATTTATVVSVQQDSNGTTSNNTTHGGSSNSCTAVAEYTVNGRQYRQASSFGSSSFCGLSPGSTININYNPNKPGAWGYDLKTIGTLEKFFRWGGIVLAAASLVTFAIRLASIIFGWKLLRKGRRLASTLPEGVDVGALVSTIRQAFGKHLFSSRGSTFAGPQPTAPQAQYPSAPSTNLVTPNTAPMHRPPTGSPPPNYDQPFTPPGTSVPAPNGNADASRPSLPTQ